jgi:hypothetical protein
MARVKVHGGPRGCRRPLAECDCPDDGDLDEPEAEVQDGGEDEE